MAPRKKDRTAEIQAIYDGLKYCDYDELNKIQSKISDLLNKLEEKAIADKKAEIERLQQEINAIEAYRQKKAEEVMIVDNK